jgi:hypothetical protein
MMGGMARFEGIHCTMDVRREAAGVVLVVITGRDVGELGDAPFQALENELEANGTLELFVDGRGTQGATIDVSNDWARWLRRRRDRLGRVTMLTGSRFIEITAEFVRRFAGLEDVMRVTTEASAFDAALAEAIQERA